MVNNSIYTNPSAYTALQNLNKVNRQLEVSQARISSGLKVASATDSTTAFSIAQGIRGEINAIDALNKGLTKVKGIIDYTLAATEGISSLVTELKAKLTELSDTNLSTAQRARAGTDFRELLSQGKDFARGAARLDEAGGNIVDLFSTGAANTTSSANITVNANLTFVPGTAANTANVITVNAALALAVNVQLGSLQATALTNAAANAQSVLATSFVTFETALATALGHLSSKSSAIENTTIFLDKVKGTRQELLGAYVDADLAAESAKLTALQVQQQLAVQAVGIANQRPQSLLGLFR
jgi:flagellin